MSMKKKILLILKRKKTAMQRWAKMEAIEGECDVTNDVTFAPPSTVGEKALEFHLSVARGGGGGRRRRRRRRAGEGQAFWG